MLEQTYSIVAEYSRKRASMYDLGIFFDRLVYSRARVHRSKLVVLTRPLTLHLSYLCMEKKNLENKLIRFAQFAPGHSRCVSITDLLFALGAETPFLVYALYRYSRTSGNDRYLSAVYVIE